MKQNRFKLWILTTLITALLYADYSVENAFPNLSSFIKPLGIEFPDDGTNRLFILEQAGRIYVIENSPDVSQRTVFLDIRNIVYDAQNEEGLMGMAFHPNYSENGYFYLNYTRSGPRRTVIERYSVSNTNPNQADENSGFVILEQNQPYWNHNGGQISFGPDGYLYNIFGDGGSAGDPLGHGQNLQTLLSTMIRIDIDNTTGTQNYSIPADNPFVDNPNARDEIYAYGLRNMWRFSWDPVTGWLWGADVGQNDWEEIDIIHPGLNYGWKIMEGNHCYSPSNNCDESGLEMPVWEYELYIEGDCSITGGYVYRGDQYFSLAGKYVYGDYCTGRIWALDYDGTNSAQNIELINTNIAISSFGLDQDNEILICNLDNGRIYRLLSDEPGALGDINQDGSINVVDIILDVNFILNTNTPNAYQTWAGDINGDGILNVIDVVNLVNQILG